MHVIRLAAPLCALAVALAAAHARSETIGGNPGPAHNYVCPHSDGKPALDCYFDAVQHLYTMCRNVKAIEIIEFGFEHSTEGLNGAKSESCLVKQKQNIEQPYRAALRQAGKWHKTLEGLRSLHEAWTTAMTQLGWRSGESSDDYAKRVVQPYDEFKTRIEAIRTTLAAEETQTESATAAKGAGKSKPASKSKAKAKAT